jgi:two-component system nitrogen regulation response regulator NtrX
MISGHGDVRTAFEASKLGAFDFLEKPPESERLLVIARNAVAQRQLTRKVSRFRDSQDVKHRLVGNSGALQKVRDAIVRAAPTNATVLITGESGVGKELVARAIHRNSLRKDEEFTIFLDEVGDMSPRTQAKVLRVLQEGEVERIGSQKTITVDVRVIAATNKRLEELVEKGEFREDLYFRLSVIPIRVPALRERTEDIPPIVEHFVRQFSVENNFRAKTFAPPAMDALKRHPWRGNVRELRNTVERLLIMVEGDQIKAEDLSDVLVRPGEGLAQPDSAATLRDFKESAERAFLVSKLQENKWNISATAAAIGTPRSNLYKKLEQYGISQEKDG